jgi:FKBP-type peptidyl-prolyl cis-trans isomerase 2
MPVKSGDKVKVDYTGTLEDGTVFDSSTHGDHSHPLEFEAGSGQVIKGFDKAVIGMEVGQEKEVKISPEEAYGERREELMKEMPRSNLPEGKEPEAGMMLAMSTPDGRQIPVRIAEVKDDNVILDMNHPLAGKTLIFKIKLLEIVS